MINPIQSKKDNTTKSIENQSTYLTDAQVQKTGLGILSSLALGLTIPLCCLAPPLAAVLGSSFLVTCAGGMIWKVCVIKDYDNPKEVAQYRKECAKMPLTSIIKKHGWDRVFKNALLTQEQLNEKYPELEKEIKGLPGLFDLYNAISIHTKGTSFEIPHPSRHLDRIRKECVYMTFNDIINLHGWEHIFSLRLLTQEQLFYKYEEIEQPLKGIPDLFNLYNKASSYAKGTEYTIPPPSRHATSIREQCKNMTLKKIVSLHGWSHLFSWRLLTEKEFQTKYEEDECQLQGLLSIQAHYNHVETNRKNANDSESYTTPHFSRNMDTVRKNCENLTMHSIVMLHGFKNIFTYKLLTPTEFDLKYTAYIEHIHASKGVEAALSIHKKAKAEHASSEDNGYSSPNTKPLSILWLQSIKNLSATEIFSQFNLEYLSQNEVLPSGQYQISLKSLYQEFQKIKTSHQNDLSLAEKNYLETVTLAKNQRSLSLKSISIQKDNLLVLQTERRKNLEGLYILIEQSKKNPEGRPDQKLVSEKNQKEDELKKGDKALINIGEDLGKVESSYQESLSLAKQNQQKAIDYAGNNKEAKIALINNQHKLERDHLIKNNEYLPL